MKGQTIESYVLVGEKSSYQVLQLNSEYCPLGQLLIQAGQRIESVYLKAGPVEELTARSCPSLFFI